MVPANSQSARPPEGGADAAFGDREAPRQRAVLRDEPLVAIERLEHGTGLGRDGVFVSVLGAASQAAVPPTRIPIKRMVAARIARRILLAVCFSVMSLLQSPNPELSGTLRQMNTNGERTPAEVVPCPTMAIT